MCRDFSLGGKAQQQLPTICTNVTNESCFPGTMRKDQGQADWTTSLSLKSQTDGNAASLLSCLKSARTQTAMLWPYVRGLVVCDLRNIVGF